MKCSPDHHIANFRSTLLGNYGNKMIALTPTTLEDLEATTEYTFQEHESGQK